jgi:hypothetical protein
MCDCTEMFDQWRQTPDYPTLYRVNREVLVDTTRAFPSVTGIRQDQLPMWVKACALRVERPWMPGRQIAWMRRSDGGWCAVVLIRAGSANNQSAVTMQLWLDPEAITTDLTIGR